MYKDTHLFFAACSRDNKEIPYENFKNSVIDGFSPEDHKPVRKLGFDGITSVWGISEGQRAIWKKISEGDFVLFYSKKRLYTHAGRVAGKEIDEDFARKIWKRRDERQLNKNPDKPRSLLMFFSNIFRIDIPAPELHDLLGYNDDYLTGGSRRPTEDRVKSIKEAYGSVDAFVYQYSVNDPKSHSEGAKEEKDRLLELEIDNPHLATNHTQSTESAQQVRSDAFRAAVREVYNNVCAVCGVRRETPQGHPEVESAHIFPKAENGRDIVQNGLALCKLHHWAFDTGWLAIGENYKITIRDAPHRAGYNTFRELEDRGIHLPRSKRHYPHPKFLEAHRQFHGFSRE